MHKMTVIGTLVLIALCATANGKTQLRSSKDDEKSKRGSSTAVLSQPVAFSEQFDKPFVTIKSDSLTARVYLPDPHRGYYRATRFNWSGMISEVEYRGHSIFRHWHLQKHNPLNPEHAVGPADEFDIKSPPLYDKAEPGERFVKIGVGTLIKDRKRPGYFFNHKYAIADTGKWDVIIGRRHVRFWQRHGVGDLEYEYRKTVTFDGPRLVITHRLTNTGKIEFSTEHYAHNFVLIDGDTCGPHYQVRFSANPAPTEKQLKAQQRFALWDGKTLRFKSTYPKTSMSSSFEPITRGMIEALATITNRRTKAQVALSIDFVPNDFQFWSSIPLCPEPFIQMSLAPGESKSWTSTMTFSIAADTQ